MGKIDAVYKALVELETPENGVTTAMLSSYLKLDRANVSRYLNQLCDEKQIEKNDGRPVLYRSMRKNLKPAIMNSLDGMIGASLSLQLPIQQAKAAILYPPRGLHTLILGETGVGKSMFAELMYQFAKESQVINENAPFVRFNCADYADNPQLVMAQIFGVKKGAYSGADSDREGLLKKADKGIFFFDEIHRLSPQGQEMLFTYIDKGYFRPLGDTEKVVHVEVQIIAATTEDTHSHLLKTFTRRIPMTITLPSLQERSLKERYYLVEEFIKSEAKRLGKDIYINKNALLSFLLYDCPNNTGQLKSDIQLSCAKAFLNFKAQSRDYILIEQAELHHRVKCGFMKMQEHRGEINKFFKKKEEILVFSHNDQWRAANMDETEANKNGEYFYDIIEEKLKKLKKQGLTENEINEILNIDIESYFKKYISDLPEKFRKEEIAKVVAIGIVDIVEKILNFAQTKLNKEFDEKVYYGLALHLNKSVERIRHGNKIYHPKLDFIRTQYADEFLVAIEIAKMIDTHLEIEIPLDEIGYITMFLASNLCESYIEDCSKVGVLVIMHGHATASSMCQVANSLIGVEFVQGLDMALSMKVEKMYEEAKKKIIEMDKGKGILLLVDMGSLNNFADMLTEETGIKVRGIDMISTPIVIEACRKAIIGSDLDSIFQSCQEMSRYRIQTNYEKRSYKKFLIITACFTGEGAAEGLKEIIQNHLGHKSVLHIMALKILDHNDFLGKIQMLNKEYQILAIVGTINISIENIPYFSASDILSGDGMEKIESLISREQDYIKIKNSLKSHIKSVSAEELVSDIRKIIRDIEQGLCIIIPQDVTVGIVLHISFMVDKLKSGSREIVFQDVSSYRSLHHREFILISQALKPLENNYQIQIVQDELAYIVRMVIENSVSV
jgi:transcriptional regulatory protein LevR/transcriptional regulator with AAA-type ATPase domain